MGGKTRDVVNHSEGEIGDVSKWSLLARGTPAPGSSSADYLGYFLDTSEGSQ